MTYYWTAAASSQTTARTQLYHSFACNEDAFLLYENEANISIVQTGCVQTILNCDRQKNLSRQPLKMLV